MNGILALSGVPIKPIFLKEYEKKILLEKNRAVTGDVVCTFPRIRRAKHDPYF
jgi:hypothetical protein